MNMNWFLRMAKWARHPPPPARVRLVAVVVGICLLLLGIELIWGWPDWLTPNRRIRP